MGNLGTYMKPFIIHYALNVIFAVIILVIGWIIAHWVEAKVRRNGQKRERLDETLTNIFAQTAKVLILIFVCIIVLRIFGIQTASLIAVLGGLSIAIGLAWQGVLKDFAAGIMILTMRPFKVGEAISIGGTAGVVDDIGIVVTKMHTFDNLAMTVPNSKIWGNVITNFATNGNRRIDLVIGFGYDDDIDEAYRVITEILAADDRVLKDPAPQLAISELGDSSVNMIVRPWAQKADFGKLKFDLTERIKKRFDEEGINFPYPSRDVYFSNQDDA